METLKKVAWPLLFVLVLAMSLVFLGGFAQVLAITQTQEVENRESQVDPRSTDLSSGQEENKPLSTDAPPPQTLLILGDSIGAGIGDERSLGIGGRMLGAMDFEEADALNLVNQAVPGSVTADLVDLLKRGQVDQSIQEAKTIVVSIGGNNLNRMRNADTSLKVIEFEDRLLTHLQGLEEVLTYIHERNSQVDLVLLGLYNPYGQTSALEDIRLLHEWNYQSRTKLLEVGGTYYVPLYDVFNGQLDTYLSIDDFHPSGAGYQRIADLVIEILGD